MQDLGDGIQIMLEEPEEKTLSAVIVIPGISGGVFTDEYQHLSNAVIDHSYACLRLQSWSSPSDLQTKTPNDILDDISRGIDFLVKKGYTRIVAVGKSFGGAMLLLRQDHITKLILWAPALFVVPEHGTIENYMTVPLAQAKSVKDITIDYSFLQKIKTPLALIHGTNDHLVPIENSKEIQQHVHEATLEELTGLDHSWKNEEDEKVVIQAIVKQLDN